jgi:predicted secreted protein
MSSRDAYVEKLRAQIDEWNREISRLEAEAEKAGGEERIRYERHIRDLREMRGKAQLRLTEIQDAGEDAWKELQEDVGDVWKTFKETLARTKSEFERGYKEGAEGSKSSGEE